LTKKTEKGLIPLKSEGLIGDDIKAKDIIIFDLDFSEIWLEIEMTLESEDKTLKILFDLKVKVETYVTELKNNLIKMGIESWAKYMQSLSPNNFDYYLFSNFSFNFNTNNISAGSNNENGYKEIELENFHGKLLLVFII
jgi:hypothetical protein